MDVPTRIPAEDVGVASSSVIDTTALAAAPLRTEPYLHLICRGCLRKEMLPDLQRDFPKLSRPGYHPTDTFTPRGTFAKLIAEIDEGVLERAIGDRLGLDLASYPRLVTVHFTASEREGRPHTDSERKLATLLLYMNPVWPSKDGCIRVLGSPSLDDVVEEVSPEEGNVFAFRRSENSWHGHTPFHGERRVVQVTWLRDQESVDRKRRTGIFNWHLKGLFGR